MHFKQDFHVYQNPIKEDCLHPRGHHEDTTSHSDQVQRPIFKVIFRSKQPQVKVICNGQNRLSCQQSYHSNLSPTPAIYKLSKYQARHLHTLASCNACETQVLDKHTSISLIQSIDKLPQSIASSVSGTLMSILPERQLIKQQMLYH